MRYILSLVLLLAVGVLQAQVNGDALPPANTINEYSEWVSASYTLEDNTTVQFEYRIRMLKKTGFACHYELEFKNNSDRKLTFSVGVQYYDQLAKRDITDAAKVKVKGGSTGSTKLLTQGCKKSKQAESKDDYSVCTACGMTYVILVE
ncbi:MAG: hypothetical protein GC180_01405 [Bacteroidetes bacterium]|nr:hypothetical protein [Bacteroidota bacterium]